MPPEPAAPATTRTDLGYFWGADAWSIEHAGAEFRQTLEAQAGQPFEVWRASADEDDGTAEATAARRRERVIDGIAEHLSIAPMFSAGTLVMVRQPGSLLRETAARERLLGLVGSLAPGNAIVFLDLLASGGSGPAQQGVLRDLVAAAGGVVREFPALSRERMEAWINSRATELEIKLAPGVARLLAERVGAYVREGDVDRRRMSELANAELEKLALYRPAGTISRDDIDALVAEAVPGSTWAFLDAIGARRSWEAARLVALLLDEGTAIQVVVTQIHRRLRELIVLRDHLAAGTKAAEIVRELRLQPYRAQKLTEQARAWQQDELDRALSALLEIDLLSKGIGPDGSPHGMSEERSELALIAWIGNEVARRPDGSARKGAAA